MINPNEQIIKTLLHRRYPTISDSDTDIAYRLMANKCVEFKNEDGSLIVSSETAKLSESAKHEYTRQLQLLGKRLTDIRDDPYGKLRIIPVPTDGLVAFVEDEDATISSTREDKTDE